MFAALAADHSITIEAGDYSITATGPKPAELRTALDAIDGADSMSRVGMRKPLSNSHEKGTA